MGSSRSGSKAEERARRAVAAMKPLGFSTRQCTAVLKRLLKVYDKNWELIEAENYSVLADAILDALANGNGDPKPEQDEIDDFPAEGDPSTSLAAAATREDSVRPSALPQPHSRTTSTTELAILPRADSPQQALALTRALGKRRHMQTIDADLQLPVDMDASS